MQSTSFSLERARLEWDLGVPISDEKELAAVSRGLEHATPVLHLRSIGGRTWRARLVSADFPVELRLSSMEDEAPPRGWVSAVVEVHDADVRIGGEIVETDRGPVLTDVQVWSVARRRETRTLVDAGRASLSWAAVVPGAKVVAKIADVAVDGACVELRKRESSVPPPPSQVLTLVVGEEAVPVRAKVRHSVDEGEILRLGLAFEYTTEDERARAARAIHALRHPELVDRAEVEPARLIELLRESGYLDLRSGAAVHGWHGDPTSRASVDLVHVADGGTVTGHGSCTLVYPRTWLFHQLATIGHGRAALKYRRTLYLSVTGWARLLARSDDAHFIAYFDREKRWHQVFFSGFVTWVRDASLAHLVALDRFELLDERPLPPEPADVDRPSAREMSDIVTLARNVYPSTYVDAIAIDERSLEADDFCPEHASTGTPRARRTFVARDGGAVVAAAICDTGSAKLSLFNLLNMAHILVRPGASPNLVRALLARVRSVYAGNGRPHVVCSPGALGEGAGFDLKYVETMGAIAMTARGLDQYRNYLRLHLGRLTKGCVNGRPEGAERGLGLRAGP